MFPVINVGPLAIQSFGLIVLIGIWIGLSWSEKLAERHQINPDMVYTVFFLVVGMGLIGARAAYAVLQPDLFAGNWLDLFSLNLRLMDWLSGILVGTITLLIYVQKKNVSVWALLDCLVPFFLVMNMAYALATLANQSAIGSESTLPWGVWVYEKVRHPVQIYHLIFAIILLIIFWPARKKVVFFEREKVLPGGEFFLFLMVFSLGFPIVQTFRAAYPVLILNINTFHLGGILLFVVSMWQSRKRILFEEE